VLKIRQLCITSLLLVSGVASAANVRLQVEGLSGELEKTSAPNFLPSRAMKSRRIGAFARVDDAIAKVESAGLLRTDD
jgi:translocation and assembly module TamA